MFSSQRCKPMKKRAEHPERPVRVLTIDDEPMIRRTIAGHLADHGYEVVEAENGRRGLEMVEQVTPDAVLVDLRMPELDGLGVISAVHERSPDTPVIVVSGTGVMHDAVEALRRGASDYIIKPIEDMRVLNQSLERALEHYRLKVENRRYNERLEQEVRERTQELQNANQRLRDALDQAVISLGKVTEKRDPYTSGHQQRVARLSVAMGEHLGLDEERISALRTASLLHDIGKIGTPAEILAKPTILDSQEMALIRMHPETGNEIVRNIPFAQPVADIILQHHERLDGSGYPAGLRGDQIMLEARIVAVADVMDAMSSHRPYRPTLGKQAALEEISNGRNILYDAEVVDGLMTLLEEDPRVFDLFE